MSELKDLHKYNRLQTQSGKQRLLLISRVHVNTMLDWYDEYEKLCPDIAKEEGRYLTNKLEQRGGAFDNHEDPLHMETRELELILRWHRMGKNGVFTDDLDKFVWEKVDSALNPNKYLTPEDDLPPKK